MNFCRPASPVTFSAFQWKDFEVATCAVEISSTLIPEYLNGVHEVGLVLKWSRLVLIRSIVAQKATSHQGNPRRSIEKNLPCWGRESYFYCSQSQPSNFKGFHPGKLLQSQTDVAAGPFWIILFRTLSLKAKQKTLARMSAISPFLWAKLTVVFALKRSAEPILRSKQMIRLFWIASHLFTNKRWRAIIIFSCHWTAVRQITLLSSIVVQWCSVGERVFSHCTNLFNVQARTSKVPLLIWGSILTAWWVTKMTPAQCLKGSLTSIPWEASFLPRSFFLQVLRSKLSLLQGITSNILDIF